MLTSMNEKDMRKSNAGSFRCSYCGWTVWGIWDIKWHQQHRHNCGKGWRQNPYRYRFFLVGPYNCYTDYSGQHEIG